MQAEIVQVDYNDDGKYDWTEEAIIIKSSTLSEATFLKSLLSSRTKTSIRLFDQESYDKWIKACAENRAKKALEEEEKSNKEEIQVEDF